MERTQHVQVIIFQSAGFFSEVVTVSIHKLCPEILCAIEQPNNSLLSIFGQS